jgi:hypothetical protein
LDILRELENENEGQKKAETSGERRPMAGAAMLAHFKQRYFATTTLILLSAVTFSINDLTSCLETKFQSLVSFC